MLLNGRIGGGSEGNHALVLWGYSCTYIYGMGEAADPAMSS
jgi:hypothetical protein